jgi:hypothetical protein
VIDLNVSGNVEEMEARMKALAKNVEGTATYRALNRAQDQTATESNRQIRAVYNIKARVVNASFKKLRASSGQLWATLRIRGMRLGLINFEARWRRGQPGGATAKIKTAGSRETFEGAFIARNPQGKLTVYRRVGRNRFPIANIKSVSVPDAFLDGVVLEAAKKVARESFIRNFKQQLDYLQPGGKPIGFAYG